MGIDIISKDNQVLKVDPITCHLILAGIQQAVPVDESAWRESGEAYLYQQPIEDEDEFAEEYAAFKKAHEETFDFPAPTIEELVGWDETIMAKLQYELGEDEDGDVVLGIEKVIDLSDDTYYTLDGKGNMVPILDPKAR